MADIANNGYAITMFFLGAAAATFIFIIRHEIKDAYKGFMLLKNSTSKRER